MKKILSVFILFAIALCGCTSSPDNSEAKSNDPIVKCFNGSFVGYVEDNGVLTFKGIPYAKAPVGELRWKAPQPVEASDEVFEAKTNGLPGLQSYDEGEVASHGDLSEDCLYLNI